MKLAFTILNVLLMAALGTTEAVEFHVSPTGSDANPGTAAKPFATLPRARDAARQAQGSVVVLAPGTYRLKKTFALDDRDSGTTYRGVRACFTGGVAVPAGAAKPVADPAILARLLPEARGKVMEIDLRALGVTDFGGMGPRGFGRPYMPAPVELIVDSEPLALSRWPKPGRPGEPIGTVIDDGTKNLARGQRPHGGTFAYSTDRPARWTKAENAWITGFFCNGYADDTLKVKSFDFQNKTLTTEQRHGYGFTSGKPWNRWTALNLLEEIELPGEYMIDPKASKLYFLPPAGKNIAKCRLEVPVLTDPMIAIEGARGVVFDGVDMECSRGIGVYIERGANNRIQNATLRNFGMVAILYRPGSAVGEGRAGLGNG